MPTTQEQYQIRLALAAPGALRADLVVWADAFGTSQPPCAVAHTVSLRNRARIARQIFAEQTLRNARTSVLVLVAPSSDSTQLPAANLAVAGALIEALSDLGLDHTSPEAALALAAWVGIRPARKHLLGATSAARLLAQSGRPEVVAAALELDVD